MFYNINKKGIELNNQECRDAIVWLSDKSWRDFFNAFRFKISVRGKEIDPVDFQYYMSVLFFVEHQSKGETKEIESAVNGLFGTRYRKEEKEEFILKFLKTINNSTDEIINDCFGNPSNELNKLLNNKNILIEIINKYINNKKYDSIADFEIEFIGLLYWTLFKGKSIKFSNYQNKISESIIKLVGNDKDSKDKYRRSVNSPQKFRDRVVTSIKIYK